MKILDLGQAYEGFLSDESRRVGVAEKIAFPTTVEQVQTALAVAQQNRWSITIQGGRTGVTGGAVPEGGLILNLSRMNAIGPLDQNRMHVQPGALLADIREAIARTDGPELFFPSDLTETTASIGGMVANNASGARSFKYGAVRNWIYALDVVLPDGECVQLERGQDRTEGRTFRVGKVEGVLPDVPQPAVKNAAGYFIQPDMDLVDLFIGAEGTLGVVVGITIQLIPKPDQMNGLTAFFESEEKALNFVQVLRRHQPVAIEFFDAHALALLRTMKQENSAFSDLPQLPAEYHTCIYFEFDTAVPDAVVEKVDQDAMECWLSEGEHEIAILKAFRHALPEAVNLLISERKKSVPELTKLGTDMSVPDERLNDVMNMYHDGLGKSGLEYVIFGHIGNNHVHVNLIPRSQEEYEKGKLLYLKWAEQVVQWGGSVSAEHGIGKNKTAFLALMVGKQGLNAMKAIKHLFDPKQLLNPGNLFC